MQHSVRKRTFDILFSLLALTLAAPLMLAVAIAVKLTSRGPVFFSHERIGRGGRSFHCYKFRTMYADAEERLEELLASDPTLKKEWEETHKLQKDPRVTPIGNFLRKTSLDELPQFWNALKGDLSVVGPRPVVSKEIQRHFGKKAAKILSIRPGITGLWQTSGRNNISYPDRIALEEEYVEKRSLLMDLRLILKTIPSMLTSRGAY